MNDDEYAVVIYNDKELGALVTICEDGKAISCEIAIIEEVDGSSLPYSFDIHIINREEKDQVYRKYLNCYFNYCRKVRCFINHKNNEHSYEEERFLLINNPVILYSEKI